MSDQRFFNHRDTTRHANQSKLQIAAGTVRRQGNDARGSDPYNTSGSFDRKKNWARVGKR